MADVAVQDLAVQLCLSAGGGNYDGQTFEWLDAEGASLIVSLCKACSASPPPRGLLFLLAQLIERAKHLGPGHTDSADTVALGVAHLLPILLGCGFIHCLFLPHKLLHAAPTSLVAQNPISHIKSGTSSPSYVSK